MKQAQSGEVLLEVRNASKTFGSVVALDRVDLVLKRGEILALLGDNGAGKSTLIKALSGVHSLDAGQILINGDPITLRSSSEARALGIETVFQDLAVFDNLNVIENLFIGREQARLPWLGPLAVLQKRRMVEEWRRFTDQLEVRIPDPFQPVGLMSGGQRQAVAIARAFAFAGRVVILDEPTAALGLRETGNVLRLVKRLAQQGVSIVLITHNMQNVVDVCHRAVVLRQGRNVGECQVTRATQEQMVSMIVGASRSEASQHVGEPLTRVTASPGAAVR